MLRQLAAFPHLDNLRRQGAGVISPVLTGFIIER